VFLAAGLDGMRFGRLSLLRFADDVDDGSGGDDVVAAGEAAAPRRELRGPVNISSAAILHSEQPTKHF